MNTEQQGIAYLTARRDIIDIEILSIKQRLTKMATFGLTPKRKKAVENQLAELYAKRLEIQDQLWRLRDKGVTDYVIKERL